MESQFLDQYTYLHFATGILFYFWGFSLTNTLLLHSFYEYFEITDFGTNVINVLFGDIWPGGGKHITVHFVYNGIGDTVGVLLGWITSYYLDKLGDEYGWYKKHIQ